MKAIVLEAADKPLILKDVEKPTLEVGEVLVQVKAAALNRRDWWITKGQYAGIKYPSILGMIDCGLLSTPLYENALIETPVFYENFVAYVSKNSALSKKKNIVPDDIDMEEIWVLNEGHCMRDQVLNICHRKKSTKGFQHFEYNTGSVETLKRMVDQNNGATILPELALEDMTLKQLDKVRYFKAPEPAREISLVTQKNFLKRKMIEALKNEILEFIPKKMRSKKKKDVIEI